MKVSKIALTTFSIVVIGTLAACAQPAPPPAGQGYTPPAQPSPQVGSVARVERGTITEEVATRGRVVAASEALLSFELEGVLVSVDVNPGSQVSEGDILAEIEIRDREGRSAEDQIVDAQYAVTIAQIDLKRANYEAEAAKHEAAAAAAWAAFCRKDAEKAALLLRFAQSDYDRVSWGGDPEKPPEKESDFARPARANLELAAMDYDKALAACQPKDAQVRIYDAEVRRYEAFTSLREHQLAHAQDFLTRAERRVGQTQIYAPFSGIIISWEKRIGERIEPYEPIGAIADPSVLRVETWVPEEEIHEIALGQPVSVTLDLHPEESYAGEVVDVAFEPTVWQGKNVYLVEIEFTDPEEIPATIRMGADVVIQTRTRVEVLLVPTSAIYTEDRHQYVEVVRDGGRVKLEVKVGISNETHTEILTGLEEGEEVVLPQGAEPVSTPSPLPTATPEVAVHIVSSGESLFIIAQTYGVTMDAIAAANGLTYPYHIYVGQELVILGAREMLPVAGQGHIVQHGDTLFSIAQAYGLSMEVLAEANGLTYPYTVYVGQRLVIPLEETPQPTPTGQTYIVQYGDTLYSIALAFGLSVEALAEANGLTYPYTIYVGQRLVIP